jgi:protocatechuate 3,4-dioxygenase beta subunit
MSWNNLRRISRRESLKVCLVPAGAVAGSSLVGGWLLGCSDEEAPKTGGAGSPALAPIAGMSAGTAGSMISMPITGNPMTSAGAGGAARPIAGAGAPAGGASGNPAGSGANAMAGSGSGGMDPMTAGASGATAGSGGSIAAPGVAWATGGTRSMMGGYPDPFAMGMAGPPCALYPSQTLGPCYASSPAMREDISDEMNGLPTRLSFLVVRGSACEPVADATVDIWHSGTYGVYSAFGMGTICNPGTTNVRDDMFCRGVQVTNQAGRADFNTVFPGWYSGRAVHIHFTVTVDGRAIKTSQLYFDDDLVTEIHQQGEYMARGMRSTTNDADFTFRSGGAAPDDVVMSAVKRPDGVLHAWKVLSLG